MTSTKFFWWSKVSVFKNLLRQVTKSRSATSALTPNELVRLSENCAEYKSLVLILGLCGLRWAEAIGLQVRDIDFQQNLLTIRRSISEVNGSFHESTTKTSKTRVIPFPEILSSYLQAWCLNKSSSELVFTIT